MDVMHEEVGTVPLPAISEERIVVIIPAYHEARVIRRTVLDVLGKGYEVVLVDDGSMDETYGEICDLPICYVRHAVNMGQGAALQTGMRAALDMGATIIVHFDADGQHKAADIPKLIAPIICKSCEVVLGSRFLGANGRINISFSKRVLLACGTILNGILTGCWLSDAHNGFRCMNRAAAEKIELKEAGMAHATEILWEIRKHKLSIQEVPVHIEYSAYSLAKGQSSWNAINILGDLLMRKMFS